MERSLRILLRGESLSDSVTVARISLCVHRWPREFEQLFSGDIGAAGPAATDRAALTPAVDIQEENDRFVVRADMPGVAAKDIDVFAEDGTLTIRGTRSTQDRVNDDGFEHVERVAGTFLRRFTLPESAQAEAIKARYADGVLEIAIPSSRASSPSALPSPSTRSPATRFSRGVQVLRRCLADVCEDLHGPRRWLPPCPGHGTAGV